MTFATNPVGENDGEDRGGEEDPTDGGRVTVVAQVVLIWLATSVVAAVAMGRFLAQDRAVAGLLPPIDS